jgi:hypothetical protein
MKCPSTRYIFFPWDSLGIKRRGNNPLIPRRNFSSPKKTLLRKKMELKEKSSLIHGQKWPIISSNTSHVILAG